jgi:hypothetical protein
MDGVDPMGRPKKSAPEEIVAKLRQVEIMTARARLWPTPFAQSG